MGHHHDELHIVLSVIIAVLGSWTALDLYRRVKAHNGPIKAGWLAATAVAMGLSIWSMHFVAMLGYHPGVPVRYDVTLTLASLALAIVSTAGAFLAIQSSNPSRLRVMLAGLAMGSGICLMHYVGMAAVRAPASIHYQPELVAASFLIAVGASWAALSAALRERTLALHAIGAVVLGFAICSMHYTGMMAVRFVPTAASAHSMATLDNLSLAFGVASSTLLLLFLALLASLFDRRFESLALREAQAIADREEHLRVILAQLPVGVVVADPTTKRLEYVNPEAERLMRAPLVGMRWPSAEAFSAIHENGNPFAFHEYPLSRALAGEHVSREVIRYRRVDGTEFIGEVSAAPIMNATGEVRQAVLAISDVTARVDAEAALRQGVKLQALGQLTGGIAHDFNNLLTIIQGSAEFLCRDGLDEDRRARHSKAIADAAGRAAALTRQLLSFARKQPLKPEIFDLNERVRETADLLRRSIGSSHSVEMDLTLEPCFVEADPSQLESALLNIGVNARDAMTNGGTIGLTTRISTGSGANGAADGEYVCIAISDAGRGIPAEFRSRVLEPFFTTKEPGKGTGLGLSQAYGFAQQSGGDLEIESTVGSGTVISIKLPRARVSQKLEDGKAAALSTLGPIRVLLVEDNEEVACFASELLTDQGLEVVRASSGEDAMQILLGGLPVDLVFSDIVMPGITGIELAEAMRGAGIATPIVLTSGYSEDVVRGQAAGLNVVPKPYRAQTLGPIFAEALATRPGRKQSGRSAAAKR